VASLRASGSRRREIMVTCPMFFTMLGALCIKVNINDEDHYNKTTFDLALAGMQFMGPILLVYQAFIKGGAKGVLEDTEIGGAMADVDEMAMSWENTRDGWKEGFGEIEMGGEWIKNMLRGDKGQASEVRMESGAGRMGRDEPVMRMKAQRQGGDDMLVMKGKGPVAQL